MVCYKKKHTVPLNSAANSLSFIEKLEDAIAKIQISPELTITHADYEPLVIPDQYRDYLKQISVCEQNRYLAVKLQQYLYAIFDGDLKFQGNSAPDAIDEPKEIINRADKWYKTKFFQQLTQSNHGQGYSDYGWLILEQKAENHWQVFKDGLTLHINPKQQLAVSNLESQPGQKVAIKMPSNLVDHGFYIAVGDAGSIERHDSNSAVVRLYFNVNSQGALLLSDYFTQQLNILKVPFDFKIAYQEESFVKPDAAILSLNSPDYLRLSEIIKDICQDNQACFKSEIPFFCKFLKPGLGLAEKPNMALESKSANIGLQNCFVIAKALIEICKPNKQLDVNKLDYVFQYASKEGVDLERPYLNPGSEATYE